MCTFNFAILNKRQKCEISYSGVIKCCIQIILSLFKIWNLIIANPIIFLKTMQVLLCGSCQVTWFLLQIQTYNILFLVSSLKTKYFRMSFIVSFVLICLESGVKRNRDLLIFTKLTLLHKVLENKFLTFKDQLLFL